MAFATKYRIVGTSDIFQKITILIKEDDFAGAITDFDGAGRDFARLKIGTSSSDISACVLPSEFTFKFYALTDFVAIELAQGQMFSYLVEVLDHLDEVIWTGWVSPEDYSEEYVSTPYVVNVRATDMLDGLKNVALGNLFGTKTTLFTLLRTALAGTRLDLRYLESISIYSNGMDSTQDDSPLTQAEVTNDTWVGFTCYDVLEAILKPFFSRVYQYRGWVIENITFKRDNYTVRLFDVFGAYESSFNSLTLKTLQNTPVDFSKFLNKSGVLNFKPALNKSKVYFFSTEQVQDSSGLTGFDKLTDWTDPDNLVSWTNENGIVILRVVTEYNGSQYAVWIDGRNTSFSDDQYIQSIAYPVDPANEEDIQLSFDYKMNYPSVIILGSKPTLFFEVYLDSGTDYWWNGTEWVTTRTPLRISASPRNAWRTYEITIPTLPAAGNIYFRLHKLVKSGSEGVTEVFLTKWVSNLKAQTEKRDVYFFSQGETSIETSYKGPVFEHYISDGDVLETKGVMEVSGVLTETWNRISETDDLDIKALFLLQWLSMNQYPTAVLQGTLYQKGEMIRPTDTIRDDASISLRRYIMTMWDINISNGVGNIVYREIPLDDVLGVVVTEGTAETIEQGDYLLPGSLPASAPPPTNPALGPNTPVITPTGVRLLNGDVTGDLSAAVLTPSAINNKARLDTTGLDPEEIVFNAVKDNPDQENMTNLRLSDVSDMIVTPVIIPKTKLGYRFTVVPNVDSDDETVGVTGMSYNTTTNEYIFSYYAFERESKLWFYGRNSSNLIPYSPSGTLTPVPDREIDVSAYLFHIQGVAFDPTDGGYYVLGSRFASSSDAQRKIIKVDDSGTLLETTDLTSLSFQAGMLALNNDANQLIIKPNNSTNVYFLNKATKALERTEVAHTDKEGLAYDIARNALWIGGDEGEIVVYDYDTFDVIYETTFETLPNESSAQNIEGLFVDPVDDRLCISFDAYLHGTNNNGNCMWKFDFPQMVYANAAVENSYTIKADYLDTTQPRPYGGGGESILLLPSGNYAAAIASAATSKPFSTAAGFFSFGLQSAAQSTRLIGGRLGDDNLWFANGPLATAYRQIASREWLLSYLAALPNSVKGDYAAAIVALAFGTAGESIATLPNGTYVANLSSLATGLPVAANFAGLFSWGGSLSNNQSARLLASRDNSDNLWFSSGPASNTYRQIAMRDWVTAAIAVVTTSLTDGYAGKRASTATPTSSNFVGDVNTILGAGLIWCTNAATNIPEAVAGMLVTSCSATAATATQIYITSGNPTVPKIFLRRYTASTWGAWVQIGGGDVTQAGTNAFTGANSFTTPPTSAADAVNPTELVRLSQVITMSSGTWTPEIETTSSFPAVTYVDQTGRWTKVGNLVHFRISLQWSAVVGGSGNLRITLPAAQPGMDNVPGAGAAINRVSGITFVGQAVFAIGTTHINIAELGAAGTYAGTDVASMAAAGTIYISGTYEA